MALAIDAQNLLDSEMHEIKGGYACTSSCSESCVESCKNGCSRDKRQ